MFRAASVLRGQQIGKLLAPLGKTALDDGRKALAVGRDDQGLRARRELYRDRLDLGCRIKNRAGQGAYQRHVVARLHQNREGAIGLVSRQAGQALPDLLLDEKEKPRWITRQAQAL